MKPVSLIKRLPAGRDTALRLWNRVVRLRGPQEVITYFGAKIICNARDIIQASIAHFGIWEPSVSRAFERFVMPGSVVVDAGANIGYYTLLAAKLVGPDGTVVAIEALPRLAAEVAMNASINGFTNVRVVNVALSDQPGELLLYEAPSTNVGMTTTKADRGFAATTVAKALPLTDVLSADELRRVSFLKCDIEGAEGPVMNQLLDGLALLSPDLVIVVEASDTKEWDSLFERFRNEGFHAYQLYNELNTMWSDLLHDKAPQDWKSVSTKPKGQVDLLLSRKPL